MACHAMACRGMPWTAVGGNGMRQCRLAADEEGLHEKTPNRSAPPKKKNSGVCVGTIGSGKDLQCRNTHEKKSQ